MDKKKLKAARSRFNLTIFCFHMVIFVGLYLLFPRLLNFPKYFDLISFQVKTLKIPLIVYFIVSGLIVYAFESLILKSLQKNINKVIGTKEERTNDYKRLVIKAREECMNAPYKFMMKQFIILAVFILLAIIFFIGLGKFIVPNFDRMKVALMRSVMIIVAFWLLLSVFEYFFLQNYVNKVIKESYNNNLYYKRPDKNTSNMASVLIQIIPILITIFVITICFSYSNTVDVTSKAISSYYEVYFNNIKFGKDELKDGFSMVQALKDNVTLMNKGDVLFVIDADGKVRTSTSENISKFMLTYKDEYFFFYTDENGKSGIDLNKTSNVIYESYGIDEHAFIKRIQDENGRNIYIGAKYVAGNTDSFKFLSIVSITMFAVYTVILIYWAKNNSDNIQNVEKNMKEILSEKDIMKKNFMPILSNDEVGNIAYYYNKIQDKIIVQNDIMFKQEQLSVLGELAGGMAHDINTPISSINTSIVMLRTHVTDPKYVEILDTMTVSAERIVNIVNSMRNQIRNLGSNDKEEFELNQMISDLHVLTQNEQKKNGCTFESVINEKIMIYGEKTKLGQVLTNIVVNGIQAYGGQGKKGNVKLTAFTKGTNTCRIEIEDQAGGIPEKVQKYLFKNIMTTKGVKGTGLGLYLAGNVIKGIYQGNIWFEVKKGVGTKFIIEIPMKPED
ncbi:MAG: HAMP domain-containing histidine kinase [Clostridia bacterium]|nr:HAMP domain-containing histidine kinase [Clostridia bacterium]